MRWTYLAQLYEIFHVTCLEIRPLFQEFQGMVDSIKHIDADLWVRAWSVHQIIKPTQLELPSSPCNGKGWLDSNN